MKQSDPNILGHSNVKKSEEAEQGYNGERQRLHFCAHVDHFKQNKRDER
jgi:hypothetical protein